MIDGKYDVIFRGQIVKSFDLATVQNNLVKLFKSSPDAVQKLFSGNEVIIRKSLDYADAMKYQSALKNAGALALIKEVEGAQATDDKVSSENVSPQSKPTDLKSSNANNENDIEPEKSDDSLTIAEVGAALLPPKKYQQKEVDTSSLSLADAGERILPKQEPKVYPQPSIDHLSLDD